MIYFLTSGAYSAFSVDGIYEGPPGLNMDELRARFVRETNAPEVKSSYRGCFRFSDAGFHDWLVATCGMKLLESEEMHTGEYGHIAFETDPRIKT